ncbi:MAG: hypothetical protein GC131_02730 [Alphaproteobacteria bacterium]|nr:hypothetical protein [Alphaproteobacteria bacterium]
MSRSNIAKGKIISADVIDAVAFSASGPTHVTAYSTVKPGTDGAVKMVAIELSKRTPGRAVLAASLGIAALAAFSIGFWALIPAALGVGASILTERLSREKILLSQKAVDGLIQKEYPDLTEAHPDHVPLTVARRLVGNRVTLETSAPNDTSENGGVWENFGSKLGYRRVAASLKFG